MSKSISLTLLPVLLLACVEDTENIHVDSPCIEVNVEINQDFDGNASETFPLKETNATVVSVDTNGSDDNFESDTENLDYHTVSLSISSEDQWEGWINGEFLADSWGEKLSIVDFDLPPGNHVLAIRSHNTSAGINGIIAGLELDGSNYSVTGDGQWLTQEQMPERGWKLQSFDDSLWGAGEVCEDTRIWNKENQPTVIDNATRISNNSNCRKTHGSSWYRLNIIVK